MRHNEQTFRSPGNDSGLSARLLGLARDVRKVIHDGSTDPEETARLSDRLTRLRGVLVGRAGSPLDRWFENLQRQLDAAACESTIH
jgi:hypothetical protein